MRRGPCSPRFDEGESEEGEEAVAEGVLAAGGLPPAGAGSSTETVRKSASPAPTAASRAVPETARSGASERDAFARSCLLLRRLLRRESRTAVRAAVLIAHRTIACVPAVDAMRRPSRESADGSDQGTNLGITQQLWRELSHSRAVWPQPSLLSPRYLRRPPDTTAVAGALGQLPSPPFPSVPFERSVPVRPRRFVRAVLAQAMAAGHRAGPVHFWWQSGVPG
jgi:hypothetical protein